jgi:hypothetical protein
VTEWDTIGLAFLFVANTLFDQMKQLEFDGASVGDRHLSDVGGQLAGEAELLRHTQSIRPLAIEGDHYQTHFSAEREWLEKQAKVGRYLTSAVISE